MSEETQFCPCCSQKMMVYRRSVRKNMIPGLIILQDGTPRKTVELGLSEGARSDFTTLRFFGLIYRDLEKDRYKWMITQKGLLFLRGLTTIPKYAFIFNNEVKRYSEERVWINQIHPEKIDLETVWKNAKPLKSFQ